MRLYKTTTPRRCLSRLISTLKFHQRDHGLYAVYIYIFLVTITALASAVFVEKVLEFTLYTFTESEFGDQLFNLRRFVLGWIRKRKRKRDGNICT